MMSSNIVWLLLLIMTVMGSVASFFLKKASVASSLFEMLKNINLYIGGGLYVSSAILNIIVLRYLDYSVVLPMTSLTYIWTMVISYMIFKEKITKKKIIGVVAIFVGAIIVAI